MGSTSRESLVVASYNIRRGIGIGGKRDTERVARVVEEISPDLIALQEVDSALYDDSAPGQLDNLQEHLGLECISGVTLRREDAAYGNALLSKLPVRNVRRHDISVEGREPRGVIDVEAEFLGSTVSVLATHLGLRTAERREQIARVSSFLDARDNLPTLLLGDFNDWRIGWGPLAALARRFGSWSGPRTFPARWPLFKLDRIWARPVDWKVDRVWTHRSRSTLRASDHLPVCARVRLRSVPAHGHSASVGRPDQTGLTAAADLRLRGRLCGLPARETARHHRADRTMHKRALFDWYRHTAIEQPRPVDLRQPGILFEELTQESQGLDIDGDAIQLGKGRHGMVFRSSLLLGR